MSMTPAYPTCASQPSRQRGGPPTSHLEPTLTSQAINCTAAGARVFPGC